MILSMILIASDGSTPRFGGGSEGRLFPEDGVDDDASISECEVDVVVEELIPSSPPFIMIISDE